jgi:hypothetical protein
MNLCDNQTVSVMWHPCSNQSHDDHVITNWVTPEMSKQDCTMINLMLLIKVEVTVLWLCWQLYHRPFSLVVTQLVITWSSCDWLLHGFIISLKKKSFLLFTLRFSWQDQNIPVESMSSYIDYEFFLGLEAWSNLQVPY